MRGTGMIEFGNDGMMRSEMTQSEKDSRVNTIDALLCLQHSILPFCHSSIIPSFHYSTLSS